MVLCLDGMSPKSRGDPELADGVLLRSAPEQSCDGVLFSLPTYGTDSSFFVALEQRSYNAFDVQCASEEFGSSRMNNL